VRRRERTRTKRDGTDPWWLPIAFAASRFAVGAFLGLLLTLGYGSYVQVSTATAWLWMFVFIPAIAGLLALFLGDTFVDMLRSYFDRDP